MKWFPIALVILFGYAIFRLFTNDNRNDRF